MNSRGSEVPTGPRKKDGDWSSMGIKISADRAYQEQEKAKEKFKMEIEKVIPNGP
jgi:hypothetical protein